MIASGRLVLAARKPARGPVQAGLGCAVLTLLLAVGGCGSAGDVASFVGSVHKEQVAAKRYADQLTQVRLPGGYDVIAREHGGTYVAAGNGPYASVAYRTAQPQKAAVAVVEKAMAQAGYTVKVAATTGYDEGVTRLEGTAPGRDLEARIGSGVVYDLPFGYVPAVPGTTGVLLVVEDHGRHR